MEIKKMSSREEEVMLYVWSLGSCYIKDIIACYNGRIPSYTTVASIVTNLVRKGFLISCPRGNAYYYTPIISKDEYKEFLIGNVVEVFFETYKDFVYFLIVNNKILKDDIKNIIEQNDEWGKG